MAYGQQWNSDNVEADIAAYTKRAETFLSGFRDVINDKSELGTDRVIREAVKDVSPLRWEWKIYSSEEAQKWYEESKDPLPLLAVRKNDHVYDVESLQLRDWGNQIRAGGLTSVDEQKGVTTGKTYPAASLVEILTSRAKRETFPGGDVKMRVAIYIATYLAKQHNTSSVFLRMIAYYESQERIGIESTAGMSPAINTPEGGDTLWMVRLVILFNGWYLEGAKIFKLYPLALEQCIQYMAKDPYVNARRLKSMISPFIMTVGFAADGESHMWVGDEVKLTQATAGSFDRAGAESWKPLQNEAAEKLIKEGFLPGESGLYDMLTVSSIRPYTQQYGYEMSSIKYIANASGYGRTDLAVGIDALLGNVPEMPDVLPAWKELGEVGEEVFDRAFNARTSESAHPALKEPYHKSMLPGLMTSNSAGGRFFTIDALVKGEKHSIRTPAKNANFMRDPTILTKLDITVDPTNPMPSPPTDELDYVLEMMKWIEARPIIGADADLLTKEKPGFIGVRSVPGPKPERMIMMIPMELMRFEGVLNMLIMRYGMADDRYTVSHQSGRRFVDHGISRRCGDVSKGMLQMNIFLSTDFTSYDLTERLMHDVALLVGMLRVVWKSKAWSKKVMGLSLPEQLMLMEVITYKSYFSTQGHTAADAGRVSASDFLLEQLDQRLSGEFMTMSKNSMVHLGILKWIHKWIWKQDAAAVSKVILDDFKINVSPDEILASMARLSVLDLAQFEVMGDDGKTIIPVSPLHEFSMEDYLTFAGTLSYSFTRNGLIMSASKFTMSSSMIEYLKVFFIRGSLMPNIMQLLPQREKDMKNTSIVNQVKSIIDFTAMSVARGCDPEFVESFFELVISIKWFVRYSGVGGRESVALPLSSMSVGADGPGFLPGRMWLGSVPQVVDYMRVGKTETCISYSDISHDLERASASYMDEGKAFVRRSLSHRRVHTSSLAVKTLVSIDKRYDPGILAYTETGARYAKTASKGKKIAAKAWKHGKSSLSTCTIKPKPFKITFDAEVAPLYEPRDIPIGGLQGKARELMCYVGFAPRGNRPQPGLVSFLRKSDPGFPGDISDPELMQFLARIPESHLGLALVTLGIDPDIAHQLDMTTMIEALIPDELEQGILGAYYPYFDLSSDNLGRLVYSPYNFISPAMARWTRLMGLIFFVTQPPPYRRVVIDITLDEFFYTLA